jgi:hypothetical protein
MSRLHRGRRLLHKELHEYAKQQGIIKDKSENQKLKALRATDDDNTIDLDQYRSAKHTSTSEK